MEGQWSVGSYIRGGTPGRRAPPLPCRIGNHSTPCTWDLGHLCRSLQVAHGPPFGHGRMCLQIRDFRATCKFQVRESRHPLRNECRQMHALTLTPRPPGLCIAKVTFP